MYHSLARFYDRYTEDVSYPDWADFAQEYLLPGGWQDVSEAVPLVLDLACGTGQLTCCLAERGYDMIGLDCSGEMLAVARQTAEEKGLSNVLWICQDMCRMNLFGTVRAMICATDGVNHLTRRADLEQFFRRAANYLDNQGVLLFDALTERYFRETIGNNVFVDDSPAGTCLWMSRYQPKRRLCSYDITIYEQTEGDRYQRSDDRVVERAWTESELRQGLKLAGLNLEAVYGGTDRRNISSRDSRRWYVCRRPNRE